MPNPDRQSEIDVQINSSRWWSDIPVDICLPHLLEIHIPISHQIYLQLNLLYTYHFFTGPKFLPFRPTLIVNFFLCLHLCYFRQYLYMFSTSTGAALTDSTFLCLAKLDACTSTTGLILNIKNARFSTRQNNKDTSLA